MFLSIIHSSLYVCCISESFYRALIIVAKKPTAISIANIANKEILVLAILQLSQRCRHSAFALHEDSIWVWDLLLQSMCFNYVKWETIQQLLPPGDPGYVGNPYLDIRVSFETVQEKTGWVTCIELWPLEWVFYTYGFGMGSFFAMSYVKQKGGIKWYLLGHWPESPHLWTYYRTSKFTSRHWDLKNLIYTSTEQLQAPQNWWFTKRKRIGSMNLNPSNCKAKAALHPCNSTELMLW